jgi:hypothetical protein
MQSDPIFQLPHFSILKRLAERLSGSQIVWAVTGSLGFALHGLPVEVHDIDIQSDEEGVYEIAGRMAAYMTEPVALRASDKLRSHFGRLRVNGIQMELMGAVQKRLPDGSWGLPASVNENSEVVVVDSVHFPVMKLEYEAAAYRQMGRGQKAEMIETWLAGKGR